MKSEAKRCPCFKTWAIDKALSEMSFEIYWNQDQAVSLVNENLHSESYAKRVPPSGLFVTRRIADRRLKLPNGNFESFRTFDPRLQGEYEFENVDHSSDILSHLSVREAELFSQLSREMKNIFLKATSEYYRNWKNWSPSQREQILKTLSSKK